MLCYSLLPLLGVWCCCFPVCLWCAWPRSLVVKLWLTGLPCCAAALITAGMTLTAAKFYSAPTTANARLLFRASLLHLPIFMGAFLLHR